MKGRNILLNFVKVFQSRLYIVTIGTLSFTIFPFYCSRDCRVFGILSLLALWGLGRLSCTDGFSDGCSVLDKVQE